MEKKQAIAIDYDRYKMIIGSSEIKKKVTAIAKKIAKDYYNSSLPPILLMVTTGGLYFGIDLSCALDKLGFEHNVDTIGLKSYGNKQEGGLVELDRRPRACLADRDVIVVEDIIDRGSTMNYLNSYLKRYAHPRNIAYCSFCVRKNHGPLDFAITYQGIEVGEGWLIGYGMDYQQEKRGLRKIYQKIK